MIRAAHLGSSLLFALIEPTSLLAQLPPVHHHHDIAAFANAGVIVRPVEGSPLQVRLENRSGRSINLITLRYAKRYRDGSGTVVHSIPQTSYGAIGARMAGLQDGANAVLGPVGSDLRMEFAASRYDDISFELDSIVFDDRSVVGPDKFDVVRQDSERNRAERMLLEGLLPRISRDKEETLSWLRSVKEDRGVVNVRTGQPDFYRWAAAAIAQGLINMVENVPDERVVQYAHDTLAVNARWVPLHH